MGRNKSSLFFDKEPVGSSDVSGDEQDKEQPNMLPDESGDICADNQAEKHGRKLGKRHIPEGHFLYLFFCPAYHPHCSSCLYYGSTFDFSCATFS